MKLAILIYKHVSNLSRLYKRVLYRRWNVSVELEVSFLQEGACWAIRQVKLMNHAIAYAYQKVVAGVIQMGLGLVSYKRVKLCNL